MKTFSQFILIFVLIAIYSCSRKNVTNSKKSELPKNIPSILFLDSLCNENSDALYYWTEESSKSEKSIQNTQDLDIKKDRGVKFLFNKKEYILYPFFKKNSSNSKILMLHLLLIEEKLELSKLKNISFDNLIRIHKEKSYYYYK
jgi:hypothetical protein